MQRPVVHFQAHAAGFGHAPSGNIALGCDWACATGMPCRCLHPRCCLLHTAAATTGPIPLHDLHHCLLVTIALIQVPPSPACMCATLGITNWAVPVLLLAALLCEAPVDAPAHTHAWATTLGNLRCHPWQKLWLHCTLSKWWATLIVSGSTSSWQHSGHVSSMCKSNILWWLLMAGL